jgi:hypothetical protein
MGLILESDDKYNFDCYPYADFASLFGYEHPTDSHCVKSQTGYVIYLAVCPVLWVSKIQAESALSTMESEYITVNESCKDLLPIVDLFKKSWATFQFSVGDLSNMQLRVHEENVGALTLSNLDPRHIQLCPKHYAF